jgi:FKBP-type peptidyl-prolyl cis-trans isomerase FkpA
MLELSILFAALMSASVAGPAAAAGAATYFAAGNAVAAKAVAASPRTSPVEVLPSGVRIEHITKGAGAQPTADNQVTVHYRGTLVATGAEFDSSYRRGQPATFGLRQVIPCWTEGMQHIAVGGKAVLVCPSNMAYGSRGAGASVPANADLRFEVELLQVR